MKKLIRKIYLNAYFFQHCRVTYDSYPKCLAKTFEGGFYVTSSEKIDLALVIPQEKQLPNWLRRMQTKPVKTLAPGWTYLMIIKYSDNQNFVSFLLMICIKVLILFRTPKKKHTE